MKPTKLLLMAGILATALLSSSSVAEARESFAYPDYSYDFMLFVRDWNADSDDWILVDIYETFQEGEDAAHYYAGMWIWEVDLVPLYNPPQLQAVEAIFPNWWGWGKSTKESGRSKK